MLNINGVQLPYPPEYTPQPEMVMTNLMTNGYGEDLGDYLKTRYILVLVWEWMPPSDLLALQAALDPSASLEFSVTFDTISGPQTGRFRVTAPPSGTRIGVDPLYGTVWQDVTVELREI